jgi:amino acid transporter
MGKGYQFGTFKGVFTPSILTILGVIMYLRFGWVLGNIGLPMTMLVVTIATAITFLTGLSLSATATNMKIGGGGAYFIISRSLGIEVGAAIGLPLFLAQSLGVAFYISGFSEAFVSTVNVAPVLEWLPFAITAERFVALVTLLVLTVIAFVSADLALKTQLFILAMITLSLVSFFIGGAAEPLVPFDAATPVPGKLPFWVVFAVFFPAVTGIEAGIAMSGDLKDPARALPRGTMAAVLTGYLVYMAIPVVLSRVVPDERLLLTNPLIMRQVARWGSLIVLGVWAATLSSALGALLGAPRTLQALSRDRVLPRFLGKGYGASNDPRMATLATFAVALVAILLGDLNLLAPILTMFFLTSYGLINLSSGLEGVIASASWRPKFRVWPSASLLGAAGCLMTMLMIDAGATLVALAVTAGVYGLMKRRNLSEQWGDMRYGILMLMARYAIQRLARREPGERTWRPNILVLSGSPQSRWYLIEMAHALASEASAVTVATIVPAAERTLEKVRSLQKTIEAYLEKRDLPALVKVLADDDVQRGAESLIKAYGFGPILPNTIVMGETENDETIDRFASLLMQSHRLGRNLVLVREGDAEFESLPAGDVDIWWRGKQANIGLTLTLAYLLKRSERWSNKRVRLKRIVKDEAERDEVEKTLRSFVNDKRLDMDVELLLQGEEPVTDLIRRSSSDAALVFLGMRAPEPEETVADYAAYYRNLIKSTAGLPAVLILSAGEVDYRKIVGLR